MTETSNLLQANATEGRTMYTSTSSYNAYAMNSGSSLDFEPRKRTTSAACLEEVVSADSVRSDKDRSSSDAAAAIAVAIDAAGLGDEEVSTETPVGDRPRRRFSFVQTLPMAHAEPEFPASLLSNGYTSLVVATEVSPVPTGLQGNGRPSLMSVKVYKDSLDTKLGIRFHNSNGRLQIAHISPEGVLGETMLRPGDSIVGIDGNHLCSSWSPSKAVAYLKECIGYITFVARNPLGDASISQLAVYKAMPSVKLGLTLENDSNTGLLRIKSLNEKRLLGSFESLLQVGDYVERINGVVCTKMDKSLAMAMIRECPTLVTIDVKKFPDDINDDASVDENPQEYCRQCSFSTLPPEAVEEFFSVDDTKQNVTATEIADAAPSLVQDHADPAFMSVAAIKATKNSKLGIALKNTETGDLVVSRLPQGGILGEFPLKLGMILISINQNSCYNLEASRALKLLRDMEGVIHLVFQNPKGNANYVMACVQKSSTSVGVSFRGSSGRRLKLCDIRATGLFGHSVLNVGDVVVAINQISCEQERPKEAVNIIKQAQGTVSILARSRTSVAVVVAHEE